MGYWVQVFSLILDSSVSLPAGNQYAGDSVPENLASNPAFNRGRQLVPSRFESTSLLPVHQTSHQQICIYVCMYVCWSARPSIFTPSLKRRWEGGILDSSWHLSFRPSVDKVSVCVWYQSVICEVCGWNVCNAQLSASNTRLVKTKGPHHDT